MLNQRETRIKRISNARVCGESVCVGLEVDSQGTLPHRNRFDRIDAMEDGG